MKLIRACPHLPRPFVRTNLNASSVARRRVNFGLALPPRALATFKLVPTRWSSQMRTRPKAIQILKVFWLRVLFFLRHPRLMSDFAQKARTRNNRSGMAILLSMFALIMVVAISTEVGYETSIEHVTASNQLSRLKAYYAAKAGVEISLLRVFLYKQALATYGDKLGAEGKQYLDTIWQMPFTWPPPIPAEMTKTNKEDIQEIIKDSQMDANYGTTILGEGGKIDINDAGSEIKPVADAVKSQLLQLFTSEVKNNKIFAAKYERYEFEDLIKNIADWVDEDEDSQVGGGPESQKYKDLDSPNSLPPNRPFYTLEELRFVDLMTDDLFDLLKNRVTVFGTKGINVNTANEEIFKALDPQFKEEILTKTVARRASPELGGPYKSDDDFYSYIEQLGMNTKDLKDRKITFLYDSELNFRILSSGTYKNAKVDITAITFDVDNLAGRYAKALDKNKEEQDQSSDKGGGSTSTNSNDPEEKKEDSQTNKIKPPKGRPTVVYWKET